MKAVNVVKTAVWLMLLAGIAAAQLKYVAVVETGIDERSGAAADITSAEVALITAELRREAVNNLPRDRFSVMTSETVQSMGGAVLEECSEENCVITLGSRIGAEYIVRGTISKFRTMLTLSVEMYETENGTLVASSDPVRSERPTELLSMAAEASANMYRKFAGGGETGRKKETGKAEKKQAEETHTDTMYKGKKHTVTMPDGKQHTVTMRYDKSTGEWYEDFTTGRRWATWALNSVTMFYPCGLGSFILMKDYVGGGIMLGATATGITLFAISSNMEMRKEYEQRKELNAISGIGMGVMYGSMIFNGVRSYSYHKPKPKTSTAADFKPYDGLKLAIVPTASGDFKVLARYDYSF